MADEKNAKLAEYGRTLMETVKSEGWPIILDIMEKMVIQAEADLIEYRGSETNSLLSLQKRALAYRSLFQGFQIKVHAEIEHAAQEPPQATKVPYADLPQLPGIYSRTMGLPSETAGPAY